MFIPYVFFNLLTQWNPTAINLLTYLRATLSGSHCESANRAWHLTNCCHWRMITYIMYWKYTAALRNRLRLCWASKQLNQNEAEGNIHLTRRGVFAFAAAVRRPNQASPSCSRFPSVLCPTRVTPTCPWHQISPCLMKTCVTASSGTVERSFQTERRDMNDGKALHKVKQGTLGGRWLYIGPVLTSFRSYLSV